MSIWQKIIPSRLLARPVKYTSLDLWRDIFGGNKAQSGQTVNAQTALQVTTVFACLRVLADGVAQVPLKLYRDGDDGRVKTPATDHPLYEVLYCKPNAWQTSFEFRETLMLHASLVGDFFAFKNMVRGTVKELIPLDPGRVKVFRNERTLELSYEVKASNGTKQVFPSEAIWHVRGPSWNSYQGLAAVELARESIGLALATEEHHSSMHKNGARPGGLLSVTGRLSDVEYSRLRTWLDENHNGSANAYSTMLLDRDAKFTPQAVNGVDSQHLETRRFQIEEICRAFRVSPIMVGYSDKATTYASAEQMFLAHVVHTLSPWYQRIEQSISANLLSSKDRRDGYYARFNANGLMRGAAADRAAFYTAALGSGGSPAWMEVNEIRALEDMNAVPWGDGAPAAANAPQTPAAPQPITEPKPNA